MISKEWMIIEESSVNALIVLEMVRIDVLNIGVLNNWLK